MADELIGYRADYTAPEMCEGMLLPGYVHISAVRPGVGRILIAAYDDVRTRKAATTLAAMHGLDLNQP